MATIFPTSVPTKRLSESISGSASSFKLNNIEGWDGNDLTSADFGTKAYGVFRNSANDLMELFEFDPSTVASASITILRRGLKFTGDLTTEVSANKLTWIKGDTVVELGSDVPQLLKHYVDDIADQTIAGVKTFTSTPVNTGGNPTASNELATKAYVDLVGTGTAITNKIVLGATAGETITAGQLVYLKTSDSRWWLCDADTAATVENIILGIAQGTGTAGNAITTGVLVSGLDTNQTGLSANTVYYASNTAGSLSSSAGTKEVTIGVATSTTSIHFFPRYNQQLTENQQDLVEAIEGGTDFYAASSTGNDSYAITITPPITAYVTGMKFRFKTDVANTGAATLAVSGLAAKTIKKFNDQDLITGDLEAGQIVEVVYDGTNFQMTSQIAQISGDGSALTDLKPTVSITAGELLTVSGNPILVSIDEGLTTTEAITNVGSDTSLAYTMDTASKWISQSFTVPTGYNRLKTVVFNGNKVNSPTGTLQAEIYAVDGSSLPTGSALATSGTQTAASVGSNADITFTFASPYTITAGTEYVIVLHHNGDGTLDGTNYIQWKGSAGGAGVPGYSTNSGSTWSATAGNDFRLQTNGYFVSSGTGRLLNSSGSKYNRKKLVGFVSTTTSDGATASVQVGGICTGFTGLTTSSKYYMSDTNGAVSSSAGTLKIKVGIALSTTTMLIQIQEVDSNL